MNEYSMDNWSGRLDGILLSGCPAEGLQGLVDSGALREVLPEVWAQVGFDQDTPHHALELWEHTKKVVGLVPPDIEIRWAALLHDMGKPRAKRKNNKGRSSYPMHAAIGVDMVPDIAERFGWEGARTEKVVRLIAGHMSESSPLRTADNLAKK